MVRPWTVWISYALLSITVLLVLLALVELVVAR